MRRGYYAIRYGYAKGVTRLDRVFGLAVFGFKDWRERLDHSILQLPASAQGRILDVGCGVGALLEALSLLGWETEGIDTDATVVALCQGRGLNARVGLLEEQHYPDGSFDVVTMMHVIEHVPDPLRTLREVYRILRPGGRLIMLTPNLNSLGHQRFGIDWLGLDIPRHLCLFTSSTLTQVVEAVGFARSEWSTTARTSRFNSLVSYELQAFQRNAYLSVPPKASRKVAARFEAEVRQQLRSDPQAGDELRLVAIK